MSDTVRDLRPVLLTLLALAAGCATKEPVPRRWLEADDLAGSVTLSGDVWVPSWVVGRTWIEVRGPEFRVEVRANAEGQWVLPAWPALASPVRVLAFVGEYPRPRAEGQSAVFELEPGVLERTVPTIRVRERTRVGGSFAAGVTW